MNTLRENAPAEIGGYKVTAVRDYKLDTITGYGSGCSAADRSAEVECSFLRLGSVYIMVSINARTAFESTSDFASASASDVPFTPR